MNYVLIIRQFIFFKFTVPNEIINKNKVILPQTEVTLADVGYFIQARLLTCPHRLLNYLAFHFFFIMRVLDEGYPEAHRVL